MNNPPAPNQDQSSPNSIKSLFQQAFGFHQKGQLEKAQQLYEQILKSAPNHFDATHFLGVIYYQNKQYIKALEILNHAININPNSPFAYGSRGNTLREMGQLQAALDSYERAIALKPDLEQTHINRANTLVQIGHFEAALSSFDQAIILNPKNLDAINSRGNLLKQLKKLPEALANYEQALVLNPQFSQAHNNRGTVLHELRLFEEAILAYDQALEINPSYAHAHGNKANSLKELNRLAEALIGYNQAIALDPNYPQALNNRGVAYKELHQYELALDDFDKALDLAPDLVEAAYNRGHVLRILKRLPEALASYKHAFYNNPHHDLLLGEYLHAKMQLCDWENYSKEHAILVQYLQEGRLASTPFPLLSMIESMSTLKNSTELYVGTNHLNTNANKPHLTHAVRNKIRIAYFSPDFRDHPVALLTAPLFELHNRTEFEVYGFSLGPKSTDSLTARLRSGFDRFLEVGHLSDLAIAKLAQELQIDIAIDLGGYTNGARPAIFSHRAAPIQASYLGYLGSMQADHYDYLLADSVIIPTHHQAFYREKIVYLPSYQVNDSRRHTPRQTITRQELGISNSSFVYACFNNNYKITPPIFDSWMRILSNTPDSVLLLYADNSYVKANLHKEARFRGVEPSRLIFTERLQYEDYLNQYLTVDLFLDTYPYNAGTTASDALWAGVPVLTRTGETFSSRVAASLLTQLNLPGLITDSAAAYEKLATELALDQNTLKQLKDQLLKNRETSPLFNTASFTKNLELAYHAMIINHRSGLGLDHVQIN